MIAKHNVKINGVWYKTGSKIPDSSPAENTEYTKTDINRMSTAELQTLAAEMGIENAYERTGGDLKKVLIERLEL